MTRVNGMPVLLILCCHSGARACWYTAIPGEWCACVLILHWHSAALIFWYAEILTYCRNASSSLELVCTAVVRDQWGLSATISRRLSPRAASPAFIRWQSMRHLVAESSCSGKNEQQCEYALDPVQTPSCSDNTNALVRRAVLSQRERREHHICRNLFLWTPYLAMNSTLFHERLIIHWYQVVRHT